MLDCLALFFFSCLELIFVGGVIYQERLKAGLTPSTRRTRLMTMPMTPENAEHPPHFASAAFASAGNYYRQARNKSEPQIFQRLSLAFTIFLETSFATILIDTVLSTGT
jgi:hypothetical protein